MHAQHARAVVYLITLWETCILDTVLLTHTGRLHSSYLIPVWKTPKFLTLRWPDRALFVAMRMCSNKHILMATNKDCVHLSGHVTS